MVNLIHSEHKNGAILSACLWQILQQRGRTYADRVTLLSHYYVPVNPDFGDAAAAMLAGDGLGLVLFGESHQPTIIQTFLDRGIFRKVQIQSSPSGATITPNLNDLLSQYSGQTPFDRIHKFGDSTTLTAAPTHDGKFFKLWRLNDQPQMLAKKALTVEMREVNWTARAIYSCQADVNGDGIVDFVDLNAVIGGFGQTGDELPGDLDGDNLVGAKDLNIVLGTYGQQCEPLPPCCATTPPSCPDPLMCDPTPPPNPCACGPGRATLGAPKWASISWSVSGSVEYRCPPSEGRWPQWLPTPRQHSFSTFGSETKTYSGQSGCFVGVDDFSTIELLNNNLCASFPPTNPSDTLGVFASFGTSSNPNSWSFTIGGDLIYWGPQIYSQDVFVVSGSSNSPVGGGVFALGSGVTWSGSATPIYGPSGVVAGLDVSGVLSLSNPDPTFWRVTSATFNINLSARTGPWYPCESDALGKVAPTTPALFLPSP